MTETLTIRPARPEERADALRLIFQHVPPRDRQSRVSNAVSMIERGEMDAAGLLVARDGKRLVGALVCTPAPGASGLVWPPQTTPDTKSATEIEDALMQHANDWLRQGGARLAQTLLNPSELSLAEPLLRNGFADITKLWYMKHTLELTAALLSIPQRLEYRCYPDDPAAFQQTLLRTYEDSQDCPEVTGVRTTEEIIEGHKSQGVHDPGCWWLARHKGRPVGVALLTELPEWNGWDLSYVGIVPEARQRGFGREIMARALIEAKTADATSLTLSVDARNVPAWTLYTRMGFEAYDQRQVYLAIWRRAADENPPRS